MIKLKVTYNVKPKRTEQIQTANFDDLQQKIYQIFELEEGSLKYMKPRLKDQDSFLKEVKPDIEILIMGKIKPKEAVEEKKEKTQEELERIKKQEEQVQRMKEQLKLNPHEKIIKRLKEKKIKERGIQFFNEQTKQPQDLKVEYALCPLYLLKLAHQFKSYCMKYSCMQKNPDGLIIEELGTMFKDMEKSEGVVCPLNWISAWICYCSDDIEYPYPTYGIDYFINRLFSTMKMAFDVQLQKKEEEPNSRMDCGTKFFGIQMLTKRLDITKLDQDDPEEEKQIEKKAIKYFLQCDLGSPETKDLIQGIRNRFTKKALWRNFYAFDIQYEETIHNIERLPKYLLVHCSRWGYPQAREQWQQVEFSEEKKSYHRVKLPRILDLYDLCDNNLKEKLDQGRYERDQMFYPYHMDQRYPEFSGRYEKDGYCDMELHYMFLDHILFNRDIYHEFWFEPLKNSKPTGEYRLIGIVMHKGDYYHRPNADHKHDCRGDFMAFVYKRGRIWVKYHRADVQLVDIDEVTNPKYWGTEGEWTPSLLMYQEIYMRNIQVEPPSEPRRDRTRTHRRGAG